MIGHKMLMNNSNNTNNNHTTINQLNLNNKSREGNFKHLQEEEYK